jgi:hypothetical protein
MFDKQPTPTTITLDGATKPVDPNALYLVDFSKLNSVNDLVVILSAMGISFAGSHPHFEVVKPFLNLDRPITIPNPNEPQSKDLNLPKLKRVK